MVDNVRAASSPAAPVPTAKLPTAKVPTAKEESLQALLTMHQLGIISKNELRKMVLKQMKMSGASFTQSQTQPSQVQTTQPESVSSSPTIGLHTKTKRKPTKKSTKRTLKLPRKRKAAETETTEIRTLVKNTTRMRFFLECTKPKSPLWSTTSGGKQTMHRILFERAAEDVINKLYEDNPGTLRAMQKQTLEEYVHWQVMRDRNNWMGKKPKRAGFVGTLRAYDFEAQKVLIEQSLSTAEDLTEDSVDTRRTNSKKNVGKNSNERCCCCCVKGELHYFFCCFKAELLCKRFDLRCLSHLWGCCLDWESRTSSSLGTRRISPRNVLGRFQRAAVLRKVLGRRESILEQVRRETQGRWEKKEALRVAR